MKNGAESAERGGRTDVGQSIRNGRRWCGTLIDRGHHKCTPPCGAKLLFLRHNTLQ